MVLDDSEWVIGRHVKWSWPIIRHHPTIGMEGLRKTTKCLSGWSVSRPRVYQVAHRIINVNIFKSKKPVIPNRSAKRKGTVKLEQDDIINVFLLSCNACVVPQIPVSRRSREFPWIGRWPLACSHRSIARCTCYLASSSTPCFRGRKHLETSLKA
jgi:hypothetical protein